MLVNTLSSQSTHTALKQLIWMKIIILSMKTSLLLHQLRRSDGWHSEKTHACMFPVLVQLIRIILRFQGPLKQEYLARTLISVMDTSYQMLAMTETFRMSSFGRSHISNIGLGRQDTHYILLTSNTSGTSGSAHTDLFSGQMQQLSQVRARTNFKELQV